MLGKIVYAGVNNPSFEIGSEDLSRLAEVDVPAKQVERVCKRIGQERVAERNEAAEAYQKLPLTERKATPAGVTAPAVAVVGCDGGRMQILDRRGTKVEAEEASDAEDGSTSQHWREDKIGLLMPMKSEVSTSDPLLTADKDRTTFADWEETMRSCQARRMGRQQGGLATVIGRSVHRRREGSDRICLSI